MSQNKTAYIDDWTEQIALECSECGERVIYSPRANQHVRAKLYHDCEDFGPPFSPVREAHDG